VVGVGPIKDATLPDLANLPMDNPVRQRLDSQIVFYEWGAKSARRRYLWVRFGQSIAALSIPVSQVFGTGLGAKIAAIFAGGFIILLQTMEGVWRDQENYTKWRLAAEDLKHHRFMFSIGAGPYAHLAAEDAIALFGMNAEQVIGAEHQQWGQAQLRADSGSSSQPLPK
jgi:hypothetical protein